MPITLSDKKHALNKVYVLNKQFSTFLVISFVLNWLWIYVTMHALCAFCITRPLNARLCKEWPECYMVLNSHAQASDFMFLKNCALALSPHFNSIAES